MFWLKETLLVILYYYELLKCTKIYKYNYMLRLQKKENNLENKDISLWVWMKSEVYIIFEVPLASLKIDKFTHALI